MPRFSLFNLRSRKRKRAKRGRKFTFHGSFTKKADAKRKEKATPGSFIRKTKNRYYVMTPNK